MLSEEMLALLGVAGCGLCRPSGEPSAPERIGSAAPSPFCSITPTIFARPCGRILAIAPCTNQCLRTSLKAASSPLKAAQKHVARWMRPERRRASIPFRVFGAKARIEYQPLGVVGVISPWNFPIQLTFSPLAGILAAGNRVMIKPSEFTPQTSALMARAFAQQFDATEIAVVQGGPEAGAAFAGLPFDHLLFTGATNVARHVMRAAADNLVPVTLELGGEIPRGALRIRALEAATRRLMMGKTLNAGQICLAPDYVMVPEGRADAFVEASTAAVGRFTHAAGQS